MLSYLLATVSTFRNYPTAQLIFILGGNVLFHLNSRSDVVICFLSFLDQSHYRNSLFYIILPLFSRLVGFFSKQLFP